MCERLSSGAERRRRYSSWSKSAAFADLLFCVIIGAAGYSSVTYGGILLFFQRLMDELSFPQDARAELSRVMGVLQARERDKDFAVLIDQFYQSGCDWSHTDPELAALSESVGENRYSVDMLYWLCCAERLRAIYQQEGIADSVFIDTIGDLLAKLLECHELHGVWGTFVSSWYPQFYRLQIFRLGRLEFQDKTLAEPITDCEGQVYLSKGERVKSIHIPSGFGPLTEEARYDSYRRAYDFFKNERKGAPLVCFCHSWLLHDSTKEILPPSSNTIAFINDFLIVRQEQEESFPNAWRVFGADAQKPTAELPERTSMQRAYKQYLLSGRKLGYGLGILAFDGGKLVTKEYFQSCLDAR